MEDVAKPLLIKRHNHEVIITHDRSGDGGEGDGDGATSSSNSSVSCTALLVLSAIVAALGFFTSGFASGYSAPAENGMISELGLSVAEYSVFGSVLKIGALIGELISGKVADIFGRRIAMWIVNIFYICGWLGIIFAKGAWILYLGRLSLGMGIGIISYAGHVYVAEITPKHLRGGFMALTSLMTGGSIAFVYAIGSIISWRYLALVGSIPCLVQIVGLIFIPESPRWLVNIYDCNYYMEVTNGQEREFEAALQRLRGERADISDEAAAIKTFTEELQLISEDKFPDLFQRKYAYSLTVGVGLMVLPEFTGINGVQFYMTSIFDLAGFPSQVGFIMVAVMKIVLNIVGLLSVDKFGRKTLLMISAAASCLGSFLLGFSFLFQDLHWWTQVTPILALIGVLLCVGSASLGLGGIPWTIIAEGYFLCKRAKSTKTINH